MIGVSESNARTSDYYFRINFPKQWLRSQQYKPIGKHNTFLLNKVDLRDAGNCRALECAHIYHLLWNLPRFSK